VIAFRSLNLFAVLLCFCVVVFGAYVRLADAGLGCPDWPGCYGHVGVPDADHEVARAEAKYPERPVEAAKAWKEMIHRYLASTLGLLIVGLAVLSRRVPQAPRRLPWCLVALVVFQGILGMWTVTWQLKPAVVTAHLFGGLATFSLLAWMLLSTWRVRTGPAVASLSDRPRRVEPAFTFAGAPERDPRLPFPAIRLLATVGLVLLVGQIFLGGWTSTNYAALACPDLPTCHGRWVPETDVREAFTLWRGLGINYEYGVLDSRARVTIHFFHRVGAVIVTAVLLLLGMRLLRRGPSAFWKRFGVAVIAALTLQVSLGLLIVKLQLPLLLAAAHNAGAALLLLTLVSLNYFAWNEGRSP
jgi:heme a synthase